LRVLWLIFCTAILALSAIPTAEPGSFIGTLNHFWVSGSIWAWVSIAVIALAIIGAIRDIFWRDISVSKRLSLRSTVIIGTLLTTYIPWDYLANSAFLIWQIVMTIAGPIMVIVALSSLSDDSDNNRIYKRSPFSKSRAPKVSTKPTHKIVKPVTRMTQGYSVPRKKAPKPKIVNLPANPKPYGDKIVRPQIKNPVTTRPADLIAKKAEIPKATNPSPQPKTPTPIAKQPTVVAPKVVSPPKAVAPPVKPLVLPPLADLPAPVPPKPKPLKIGGDELVPRESQTVKPIGVRDNDRATYCSKCGTRGVPFASFCKKCGTNL
jgi:hypothetical protein